MESTENEFSFTFIDLLRGFIPQSFISFLSSYLSPSSIRILLGEISLKNTNFTKKQIWIPRCQALFHWENDWGLPLR
ncbi:hypothetical protein RclHR1_00030032 [Rhizophagus clarus]|uniref:Uncharacterized protein n=1 Tax=Rhizophagus clarus TaxID=94130 RepID=A0A2Z6R5T8_9GLOM|nr:hypothetical protein RclHR1_00030032 [Rhizophagus clarus]GES92278.1 hypothetical protein RCL_e13409_RclHR1_00030032 [Rhizophagus clarus]